MTGGVSPARRRSVIDALRRGTVPDSGLDLLAVGLDRFAPAFDAELAAVRGPVRAAFKAVRGEYGSGKTFFTRWLGGAGQASGLGHRRGPDLRDRDTAAPAGNRLPAAVEQLATATASAERVAAGARRLALRAGGGRARRRRGVAPTTPTHSASRRRHAAGTTPRRARPNHPRFAAGPARLPAAPGSTATLDTADGLAAWLGGQPHVAAAARRAAGVRGDIDHFARARLPAGAAHRPARLPGTPACAGARRGRDPPARAQRRTGQGPQRAAPAARRGRRRPVPRPLPGDHRHARVLRRAAGSRSGSRRWPSGCTPTSPPTPGSTTRGRAQVRLPGFDTDRARRARRARPGPLRRGR